MLRPQENMPSVSLLYKKLMCGNFCFGTLSSLTFNLEWLKSTFYNETAF